jgi:hypothetical protein
VPDHRTTVEWLGEPVETLEDLLRPGLRAVFVGINPAPNVGSSCFWIWSSRAVMRSTVASLTTSSVNGKTADSTAYETPSWRPSHLSSSPTLTRPE